MYKRVRKIYKKMFFTETAAALDLSHLRADFSKILLPKWAGYFVGYREIRIVKARLLVTV